MLCTRSLAILAGVTLKASGLPQEVQNAGGGCERASCILAFLQSGNACMLVREPLLREIRLRDKYETDSFIVMGIDTT